MDSPALLPGVVAECRKRMKEMEETFKILIVDDDRDLRAINCHLLKGKGYHLLEASNGSDAMTMVRTIRPDLVLLDVVLPDRSGIQICRDIKADPDIHDVFVILISSVKTSSGEQATGLEFGADGYIVRPIEKRELLARIEGLIRIKKLQAQFRRAQKIEAIGTLSGGLAHDFNNLLGAILGYTEMALGDIQPNTPPYSYLNQVLAATHRARDLVKHVLAFGSKGTTQSRRPVEVAPIIREALELLKASLADTIELRQQISTHSVVSGDPAQLHQVLMNLCTNAVHAMRETGGVLEVTLGEVVLDAVTAGSHEGLAPGEYVRLTVRDTGRGMDAATLERIFDPYFTTKETGEGSGLGLALVHGVIKRHEGAIGVRSALGKGTMFEILLPKIENGQ